MLCCNLRLPASSRHFIFHGSSAHGERYYSCVFIIEIYICTFCLNNYCAQVFFLGIEILIYFFSDL